MNCGCDITEIKFLSGTRILIWAGCEIKKAFLILQRRDKVMFYGPGGGMLLKALWDKGENANDQRRVQTVFNVCINKYQIFWVIF